MKMKTHVLTIGYSFLIHIFLFICTRLGFSAFQLSPKPNFLLETFSQQTLSLQLKLVSNDSQAPSVQKMLSPSPVRSQTRLGEIHSPTPIPEMANPFHPSHLAFYLSQPPYPPDSRRLGEEGSVILLIRPLKNSSEFEILVKKSSGFSRLDQAAMLAPRQQSAYQLSQLKEVTYIFELN